MLSQRARYALKALLNLARHDAGMNQVRSISAEENIPRRFLEVIMADMRKAGLVESMRGKTGGYRLARPASLITFAEIIRITDGAIALVPCVSRNFYAKCDDCVDERTCEIRQVMSLLRTQMSAVLDYTTLADAVAGTAPAVLRAG